ncbi:recombinase family protein [Peribacillus simplex]|uniref:recombinase family protein n=1 Tax=Peribacillus simplex TaxID=1478 RepID=UPI003D9C62EF
MLIGYPSVSTGLQNLDLQTDALTQHDCTIILHNKMRETKKQRPDLEETHQYACEGDTIVVWRLDQLGHNMQVLIQIEYSLIEIGMGFHSLPENLSMDKSNATGWRWFNLKTVFEIVDLYLCVKF